MLRNSLIVIHYYIFLELLGFASYEEQYIVTTESLHGPCSSSKENPLDRPLQYQNQCDNEFEEVLDKFDEENCHIDINCLDSDSDPIDSDIEWFDNTNDTTVVTSYLPEYEDVMNDTEYQKRLRKS